MSRWLNGAPIRAASVEYAAQRPQPSVRRPSPCIPHSASPKFREFNFNPVSLNYAMQLLRNGNRYKCLCRVCKAETVYPRNQANTNAPTGNWALQKNGYSASIMLVKSLYVKSLPNPVTKEQLKMLFEHLGEITKVVLPPAKAGLENRFSFVPFKERSMAMKALQNTKICDLDDQLLNCTC